MADLLECVIQIKALRETLALAETETPSIAGAGPADAEAAPVWPRMADAERRYAEALGTEAGVRPAGATESGDSARARAAFAAGRRANLAMLGDCSAAQLGGPVEWPGRPSTTVADLVAIMLANDTEVLGGLRHGRSAHESRAPTPYLAPNRPRTR